MKRKRVTKKSVIIIVICYFLCGWVIRSNFDFQVTKPVFEVKEIEIHAGMHVSPFQLVSKVQDTNINTIRFKEDYNFTKVGDVRVTIVVEDIRGNTFEKNSIVHVLNEDLDPPVITGVGKLTIRKGDTKFNYLKGIQYYDSHDPRPTITVDTQKVNINVAGQYEITYIVRDRAGNATKMNAQVEVIDSPELGTTKETQEKVVFLTFDDGPSYNTKKILDILNRFNARATFFVTGTNPDYFHLIREAHEQGHTIGMHTYTHDYAEIYASMTQYYKDLDRISDLCREQIGYVPKYIRFPGGSSNTISKRYRPGIMKKLVKDVVARGYQFYDWNASSGDGEGTIPSSDIIKNSTSSKANNIVLLCHDSIGKETTVEALPSIIRYYQKRGYTFAGIDDYSYSPHHAVNN